MCSNKFIFLIVPTFLSIIKASYETDCILPPYPEHGSYTVAGELNAEPGQTLDNAYLNITCDPGYNIARKNAVFCVQGLWSRSVPECVRSCKLNKHPSVVYKCLTSSTQTRECNKYEPIGTIVKPECNAPNYYSTSALPQMRCIEGSWDYVATCTPECGTVDPDPKDLILNGEHAAAGEMPWHTGIYKKQNKVYQQVCAGSLISTTVIISVAHCFWREGEGLMPATDYAAAVSKLHRSWNDKNDVDAQKSDIKEIQVPSRFRGAATNLQDDIAVVIVSTPFLYNKYVRPVCVDFDLNFDKRQLQDGQKGQVPGWQTFTVEADRSTTLQIKNVEIIDIMECLTKLVPGFREFITSDKFCGEFQKDKGLCVGNSGGGAVFQDIERGVTRYYLRGLVSTASRTGDPCDATIIGFTQLSKHEHFIKQYL